MGDNSEPQSRSFLGIFKESLKTICRNTKLLVPILLVVFVSMSMLDLAEKFIVIHFHDPLGLQSATNGYYLMFLLEQHPKLLNDLIKNLDQLTFDGALDDTLKMLVVKLMFLAFSWCVTLIFFVTTVSSSYEAYTAKVLGPKDMLLKVRISWKKPLVTTFYMILSTVNIILIVFILFVIDSILPINSVSRFYSGFIIHYSQILYIYVASRWMVSVVVSVLEESVAVNLAISRGEKLVKDENLKALFLMVPFAIAYVVVGFVKDAGFTSYDLSRTSQLAIHITLTNGLDCLVTLFMFVVYTVYYHEFKTGHEDNNEVKDHLYLPIPAGEA